MRLKSSHVLALLLLACIFSFAAIPSNGLEDNKATRWFQQVSKAYFEQNQSDKTPPVISEVSVSPTVLKQGDPRSEINAFVYDPAELKIVYAEVDNRMNLMLDLRRNNRYTGYCGSNLPPGTYKVTIVAIDRAGNAAQDNSTSLTILDPNDLNGNHIDDSLEKPGIGNQDLRVIVLHEGNLSGLKANKFKMLNGSSVIVPGSKLQELSQMKGVKRIYKDQKLKVLASPGGLPSAAKSVDDPRKKHEVQGDGITVALLDTGADSHHVSLDKEGKILAFKDFVNNQTKPYDDNGHGTHCASLIAGAGEQGGVAPDAKLVIVKVMDRDGACYLSDAIRALDWCLENKDLYRIRVISFSVGGESPSDSNPLLDEYCNKMIDQGMVTCVAAGNSGPASRSIVIPGDAEKVITVGAVDGRGAIFERSSRGPTANGEIKPDIVTLGVDVISALAGSRDGYSSMSGTSMAVPQLSGSAALLLQAHPQLRPADAKRIFLKTADDLGQPGPDNDYGYGALNLTNALKSLEYQPEILTGPVLEKIGLSRYNATVGDPVLIEAKAAGDIKEIDSNVTGPDRNMVIPMGDFDSNGVYSARWETSFWTPGNYEVKVDLTGRFGEEASMAVPFRLDLRR